MAPLGIDELDLTNVMRPANEAETLPPECYTDPDFFATEMRQIFRKSWNGVGREDRLQEDGDFAAFELAGVPVLLVRNQDGELRAYANTCRHRGMMLAEGEGNCRVIVCPFHGWTYGLDGQLLAARNMEHAKGMAYEDYGLVPLRLGTRDGFVFVTFDEDVPPLDTWLGDFSQVHAPWNPGDLVSAERREFEVACNWKLYNEVFNEYYHLPWVHPQSIGSLYDTPDDPDIVSGQYVTQFGTHETTSGLFGELRNLALPAIATLEGRHQGGTRYTWAFPGMTFAVTTDSMWMYEVYPLAPDRTRVVMTICFPKVSTELIDFQERAAGYIERMDIAMSEDIPMLERQQKGLSSPFAKPGRFSELEPNVAGFAHWFAQRITA